MHAQRNIIAALSLCAIFSISNITQASQLRFVIDARLAGSPNWTASTPMPTTLHASFSIDTFSATNATYVGYDDPGYYNDPAMPYLGYYAVSDLTISDISFETDQGALSFSPSAVGSTGGSGLGLPGDTCPCGFFAGIGFRSGTDNFSWDFDPSAAISMTELNASNDPLAYIYLNMENLPSNSILLEGDWGSMNFVVDSYQRSVSSVPVPPAAWLFGSGLIGLIGVARKHTR